MVLIGYIKEIRNDRLMIGLPFGLSGYLYTINNYVVEL